MRLNDLYTSLKQEINITDPDRVKDTQPIQRLHSDNLTESFEQSEENLVIKKRTSLSISAPADTSIDHIVSKKKGLKKIDISSKLSWIDRLTGKNLLFSWNRSFGKYDFSIKLAAILFFIAAFLWFDKLLVTAYVESWYKRLLQVGDQSWNIELMQKNLSDARFDFIVADILYYPLRLIPSRDIRNGHHIIRGGKNLSQIWDNMFGIYSSISQLSEKKWIKNIESINLLRNIKPELIKTDKYLNRAVYHYDSIKNLEDSYIAYKLKKANEVLKTVAGFNESINANYDKLLTLLGSQGEKKYLVVFQNADEIRPTGWFMWSMWIATLANGKLKSFDKRDVYNYEWNLKTEDYERTRAPKWIDQITQYLWLRDANYFINLKDSSNNIRFFMEKAWFKIDGVIYVNQNLVLDLLEKTGPVKLDYLDREITHNNFSAFMSTIVEAKITKIWTLWTPKQVLFDFIDGFTKSIEKDKKYADVANVVVDNLLRREIGIYSFDESENNLLRDLNLNYNIDYSKTLDFSYPVYTSISWNKSYRYIKREYNKNISINDDCSIDTNLEITLKHLMTKNKQDAISDILRTYNISNKNQNMKIQWLGPNHSFMRILLPKDAIIQDNNLISIIEHPSSKEVNFFMKTRLLETRWFNIYYSLPNPNCKPYDFKLYKQPWIPSYDISILDERNNAQKSWVNTDFYYSIEQ